ncbi:DUF4145 domain-containing protein [Bradyrhizobium sp. AZCC 2262]|uniref:DUF4145 domain-containing protein n=1 Tax=Bradyrhizobium sp. AZCC 2262 TaxID=3117022 RepID=UPI002FF165FE
MSLTTEVDWPEINSVNLDEMLNQPLPSLDRQITNLLIWTAAQLGDDHLGEVELPDEEDLTAVIGTIDGRRVDDLISRAERSGFITFVPDECIAITAKGWERLQPPSEANLVVSPTSQNNTPNVDRIIKAHCNTCRGATSSWIRAAHSVDGTVGTSPFRNRFDVLQCCGCDSLSVRHEHWFSEWDEASYDEQGQRVVKRGVKVIHYPSPTVRPKPVWSDAIDDEILRNVMDELYLALNAGMSVLASVGARTLLDRAGHLLLEEDPRGGFEGKLSGLVDRGFISRHEKATLEAVADAGNASAHRGYTPNAERLGHIVDIMENFLQRAFVLPRVADEVRSSTPRRPKGK